MFGCLLVANIRARAACLICFSSSVHVCGLLFPAAVFREGVGSLGSAEACFLRPGGLVRAVRRIEICVATAGLSRALNRAVFYFRVGVRQSLCSHNDGGEQKQQSTRAAGALVLSEAGVSMETCRRRQ